MSLSISIITATYNAESTILDNLLCLKQQNYPFEHILIDGESKDNTLELLEKNRLPGSTLVSERDKGIYDAMNKGIGLANGEVIGILNADDFYASNTVLEEVAKFFQDPGIDACYGDLVYVRERGRSEKAGEDFKVVRYWKSGLYSSRSFYWGWMPPHPTFFVRRRVYEEYGLFNLSLGSAADYEIMLRFLLKHKVRCAYIPEVLVNMRVGGVSNASIANRLAANRNDRKAWEMNGLRPYPWTLTMKPLRKVGQWVYKKGL